MDEADLLRRVRRCWAWTLVWGGRVVLVGAPLYALWCRHAQHGWHDAPHDAWGSPTGAAFGWLVGLGMVWGAALPLTLLPFASHSLVREDEDRLVGITVLGRRDVPRTGARETIWLIPGRGVNTGVRSVHRGRRWLLISGSEFWEELPQTDPGSSVGAAWARGILILLTTVLSAFVGATVVMAIAGA